jgi:hypothetical protein
LLFDGSNYNLPRPADGMTAPLPHINTQKFKFMKKIIVASIALAIVFVSACGLVKTVTSTTTIAPNEQFVLGNNEHRSFRVEVENTSRATLDVYKAPINGGKHSPQQVKPSEKVSIDVDANTALVIGNPSEKKIDVRLNVYKESNLSMGYEQKKD